MAAVEFLRGFISERLTAAAAEILGAFEQTIVQYEEEMDRQRKLLDLLLKPEIKLHRIDLPQQHSFKVEDVLADQQLCNQKKNSILDQDEPEPPQVKEEQQEVCTSHEGEQHVLKEETDPSIVTAAYAGPEPNHDMVLSHNAPQVLLQQQDCKEEEILSDQQLCNQEKSCSLDHFDPTVIQYKEEINHQDPLNIILTPGIQLHRTDLTQQHNCMEEELILVDQQLCNKRKNSILDQEQPELPQVKEEQQEVCISHEGEQHVLKEETDPSIVTAAYDGPEPNHDMVLSQVLTQQHDCKEEEALSHQQLCNQERNCSLDRDEPEPTQITEEQRVLCSSDEGEQHALNEESDPFFVTAAHESHHIQPDPSCDVVLSHNSPGKKCLKYFCQLEVDTNSVHRNLKLSDNNRKVTHVREKQTYPDHPDRFDCRPQLLCRNVLTGRCYWEVEWRGMVEIALSYRRIRRKGDRADCMFGRNNQSWTLSCSDVGYSVWHNNRKTYISSSSVSHRVAVYVDCPAGTLSFYRVSSDTLIHLHTFSITFTQPLHAGFGAWYCRPGSSVSLCCV